MNLFESPRKLKSLQHKESFNSSSTTVDLLHSDSDDDQDDDVSMQTVYKEIQCKECHSEQVVDSDEIIYKKHYWFDSVKIPSIDDVIRTTSTSAASSNESRNRTTTNTVAVVTHSGKKRRRTENTSDYDLTSQLNLNKDNFSTPDRNRNGTQHGNRNDDALQGTTRQGNISSQIQHKSQDIERNGSSTSITGNGTTIVATSHPQNISNKQETRNNNNDIIELLESDEEQPTNANQSNRNIIELLDSDNEDTPLMDQYSLDRIRNRRRRNRQRNRNRRIRENTSHAVTAIDVDLTLE